MVVLSKGGLVSPGWFDTWAPRKIATPLPGKICWPGQSLSKTDFLMVRRLPQRGCPNFSCAHVRTSGDSRQTAQHDPGPQLFVAGSVCFDLASLLNRQNFPAPSSETWFFDPDEGVSPLLHRIRGVAGVSTPAFVERRIRQWANSEHLWRVAGVSTPAFVERP